MAGFAIAFCAIGATFSAALCYVWNPRKGDRRDMKRRHKKANFLTGMLEFIGTLGWAALAIGLVSYWWVIPIGLLLIPVGVGSAWIFGRKARASGVLA